MTQEKTLPGDKIRSQAIEVIAKILAPLPAPQDKGARKGLLAPPGRDRFKCIDPAPMIREEYDEDWWVFPPQDCTPEVLWPIRACVAVDKSRLLTDESDLQLTRVEPILPRDARGVCTRFSRHMLMVDHGYLERGSQRFYTARCVASFINGQWLIANGHGEYSYGLDFPCRNPALGIDTTVKGATSVALRHRYEWAVEVGFQGTPTVRFVTDPVGIREVFRLRDLPPGRDRRAALIHWVREHWRRLRKDPSAESFVREHSRGMVEFTWEGMTCIVHPPIFDLEQLERKAEEAKRMRAEGRHIRRRAMA